MTTYSKNIVILNSTNYQGDNRYVYRLPVTQNLTNCLVSVSNLAIYNSTFNISSALNNNRYSIIWFNNQGLLNRQYDFVIPDGYYSLNDLSSRIAFDCNSQNLFLRVSSSASTAQQIVNFFQISANSVRYKAQLTVFYVPTAQQAQELKYEKPVGADWNFPSSATTPQIIFQSSALLKLLGYPLSPSATRYPETPLISNNSVTPSPLVYLSSSYPQVTPIFAYIFCCSLCDSTFNNVPTVLLQVPLTRSFGELITFANTNEDNILPIRAGNYSQIEITLLDQNYLPLRINDPDMVLTLSIHIPST